MKSALYFSSENIEVVGYTGSGPGAKVKAYESVPLGEGTVMNGRIIDADSVIEHLSELRNKHAELFGDVSLTVDGSTIFTRQVYTPRLSAKQYLQLARDEFSEVADNFQEMVVAYRVLSGGEGGQNVLICAADKAQVESYIAVCRHAGIKLNAIHIGVEAMLNYASLLAADADSSVVVNVVDGVTMLSMIFDNGRNVFMSRTRIYGEGDAQYLADILDNLSGLINFTKSERYNYISRSYYLGLSEKKVSFMREVNSYPEVRLDWLDMSRGSRDGVLPQTAQFPCLHAMLGSGSIDLIKGLKSLQHYEKSKKPKKRWIYVFALLIAAIAIPAVIMYMNLLSLNADVKKLKDYVEDPAIVSKAAELEEMSRSTEAYDVILRQVEAIRKNEEESAVITNRILDTVMNYTSIVTVEQLIYTGMDGVLRVSGTSPTQVEFARYVENLKGSDLINDVQYSGYSTSGGGVYSFTIDIYLAVKEAE